MKGTLKLSTGQIFDINLPFKNKASFKALEVKINNTLDFYRNMEYLSVELNHLEDNGELNIIFKSYGQILESNLCKLDMLEVRTQTVNITVEIKTNVPLDTIQQVLTKGIYRALDSSPNYIASSNNIKRIVFN